MSGTFDLDDWISSIPFSSGFPFFVTASDSPFKGDSITWWFLSITECWTVFINGGWAIPRMTSMIVLVYPIHAEQQQWGGGIVGMGHYSVFLLVMALTGALGFFKTWWGISFSWKFVTASHMALRRLASSLPDAHAPCHCQWSWNEISITRNV